MEVVVVNTELIQVLVDRIAGLEKALKNLQQPPLKDYKPPPGFGWVRLTIALDGDHLNVSKDTWDRKLKKLLKYRVYDGITWVHLPSVEKWMMEKAIN